MAVSDFIKKYFEPTEDLRIRDVVREIPSGALQTGQKILGGLKSFGQTSMRGYAAIGGRITGQPLRPSTFFQQELYGTAKEITPESFAEEIGLKKTSRFALPVGLVLGASDLIPGGKVTKSGAVSLLKNVNKADEALNILTKTMGVAKDVATKYLDDAVRLTDEKQLSSLVDKVVNESQSVSRYFQKGKELLTGVKQVPDIQDIWNKGSKEVLGDIPIEPLKVELPMEKPPLVAGKPVSETISGLTPTKVGEKEIVSAISEKPKSLDEVYQELGKDSNVIKETDLKLSPTKIEPKNLSTYKDFKTLISSKWTKIREYIQDDWIRVKKLVEMPNVKVSDTSNPYNKEILFAGKVDTRIAEGKNIVSEIDKDIIETSKKLNIKDIDLQENVNKYLQAKHAPERNLKLGDGAAGMTTKEAEEIVSAIESSADGKEIARISQKVLDFNKQTLDILLEGEVIDKELYDLLRTTYKNHVPLQRIMGETEDVAQVLSSGRAFDVKGTGLMRAKGSEKEVNDILSNVIANYEQAVVKVEKNIVDNATLQFARDNKHLDLFEEVKPKAIGRTFDKKIILEKIDDPSVLVLREKGKPIYLKIKDPNLAVALRGVNRQKVDGVLRLVGSITRFYSGLATRFNPEFAFPNKIRDLQETMIYLGSKGEMGLSGATKALTEERRSYGAIFDFIRGKDTEGSRLYKQLQMDGGTTGGMGLSTRKQVDLDVEKIRQLNRSNIKQAVDFFVKRVDDWNTIFEDSTRLSVYRSALSKGVSRDRAAVLAKEASVNFNKFGKGGPLINSLYMFANASIQGSAKMLIAMKNPKVAGTVITAVGTAVAATNEWNDKIDTDWRDKVSKWDKLNSLIVMLPSEGDAKYIAVPVSWGIKPIKVAMDYGYNLMSGRSSVGESAEGIITSIIEGYNPIGGTDLLSAITPTILDLSVDIARNKSWSGSMIRPDWDKYAPNSIKYFGDLKQTPLGRSLIKIADVLSEKTGGRIEISPADLDYTFSNIVGGAGRFISKSVNTINAIGKKEVLPTKEIPFASRFYRVVPEERVGAGSKEASNVEKILMKQSKERFELNQSAELLFQELKKLPKEERKDAYLVIKKENPTLADKINSVAEEETLGLNYVERRIKLLGVQNGERAKYLASQFKTMDKEEKINFYKEMREKKIITDEVAKQLNYLMSK